MSRFGCFLKIIVGNGFIRSVSLEATGMVALGVFLFIIVAIIAISAIDDWYRNKR